ncbi:choline ABC transporter permease subunit [Inquilinus limosus]|uniref:choline ABC transporter permease subunit n=1 Tax=Inquilinus limosus TaxID=171674 RepID=UPI003F18111F
MDELSALLSQKIPLGLWIKRLTDFLTDNFASVFDAISIGLGTAIEWLIDLFLWPPPLVFIAIVAVLAYLLHRRWQLVALVAIGFLLILNLGYWTETMQTLALVICATVLSLLIGIPIGILCAHRPLVYAVVRPILDLMQTLPTFVYLIPTLILFGLGVAPGLISTVVFAVAAPIRLTYLGIHGVPSPLLEAGEAFGATKRQLLFKVELPHALPTIMAGLTQCIMLSLSMVVIAALVGADGLGKPVVRALNSVNVPMGFEAGLCIVILAVILDRLVKSERPVGGAH